MYVRVFVFRPQLEINIISTCFCSNASNTNTNTLFSDKINYSVSAKDWMTREHSVLWPKKNTKSIDFLSRSYAFLLRNTSFAKFAIQFNVIFSMQLEISGMCCNESHLNFINKCEAWTKIISIKFWEIDREIIHLVV